MFPAVSSSGDVKEVSSVRFGQVIFPEVVMALSEIDARLAFPERTISEEVKRASRAKAVNPEFEKSTTAHDVKDVALNDVNDGQSVNATSPAMSVRLFAVNDAKLSSKEKFTMPDMLVSDAVPTTEVKEVIPLASISFKPVHPVIVKVVIEQPEQ